MKKLKKFEKFTTVKLGDLENNWSPEYYNFKKEGKLLYVKKGGKLEKVDIKKTIPKDGIFMIPEDAEKYNLLADELLILKQKQDEIINKSQEMNKLK